jgi:serine/threonine protein kinase
MKIPGYEVIRTIGRGGMAVVYLARQKSLDREVVLKVMNTTQSENKDFTERFLNEGRIVAALRHPHIITIYDIGRANDLVYIAMEYVEGGDLKDRTGEPTEPRIALDYIIKIGEALEYAHDNGIIHRDVKPANILFRGDGTILLSDFGIAKQLAVDTELTSTGTILGSPFYMSPEQAEGLVVDGRTDIYSLGVIMYEMLVGHRPYQGDSAIKVIMQHIQSPLPVLPPELSDYQPLLAHIMAKKREERVPDAGTMVKEVEAFLGLGTNPDNTVATLKAQIASYQAAAIATPEPARAARPSWIREIATPRVIGLLACVVVLVGMFMGFYIYTQTTQPTSLFRARSAQVNTGQAPATTNLAERSGLNSASPASDGVVVEGDVVKALEWLAQNSIREDRLTHPPADNAYYYYSRLLALDPQNKSATSGFSDIAERFVVLAEMEFSRRNYGQAQTYIALGLQVQPDNEGLISLRGFIENHKKSMLDTIMDLFNS